MNNTIFKKTLPYSWVIIGLSIFLSSCARAPLKPSVYPTGEIYPTLPGPILRQDVFHIVAPGETLWRISKMYDVGMQDIIRANNLERPEKLEMGQRLIIPQAAPIRPVIPLYRTHKWKYIIIHHSATDEGNAFSLFNLHLRRGFASLGYHFIINNGTYGKGDGQIEVAPRWIRQEDGAHCISAGMNHMGIGICLVGNFSKERVSQKQLDALIYLVKILKNNYHIPEKNIMGHGQVPGARTECPGTYFPWEEFKKRLSASD
jgi:LysM repeat protein